MKISDLMALSISEFATPVKAFSPTDRVSEVIGFMRETRSYEAVVEEGDRTSIVTVRDLLDLISLDTRLSKLMHQVPRLEQAEHGQRRRFPDARVQDEVDAHLSRGKLCRSGHLAGDSREADGVRRPCEALLDNDQGASDDRVERDPCLGQRA